MENIKKPMCIFKTKGKKCNLPATYGYNNNELLCCEFHGKKSDMFPHKKKILKRDEDFPEEKIDDWLFIDN